MTLEEKYAKQLEIEENGIEMGIKKYQDEMIKAYQHGALSDLPSGVALTSRLIEPVAAELRAYLGTQSKGGRKKFVYDYLNMAKDEYVLAFIAIKTTLNNISYGFSGDLAVKVQKVCENIGEQVLIEINMAKFKKENAHYYKKVIEQKQKQNSSKARTAEVLTNIAEEKNVQLYRWSDEEKFWVGQKLLDMFIKATGLVNIETIGKGKTSFKALVPTAELIKNLSILNDHCAMLNPTLLPMIVPPRDWTPTQRGGFLSEVKSLNFSMIRTHNKEHKKLVKNTEMPIVYEALNTLQRTAWTIKKEVAEVFLELWDRGHAIPELDLETKYDYEMPVKPWGELSDAEWEVYKAKNPELVQRWKHAKRDVINANIIARSKRIATEKIAMLTRDYMNEEEMYFCWNLDFRGRIYPLQPFLNPQGNDLAKALLKFKEGKPLGEHGAKWLAIQGANTWGEDKISMDDRVKWVYDNEEMILSIAKDPLTDKRWYDAGDPWKFLSFCFEWLAFSKANYSEDFVSHLPIALDGSNNGVQHLSAMLRDPAGAKATNLELSPDDKPADIYQEVADLVTEWVNADAANDNDVAKLLVGKVNRSVCKRNTMTTAYGVTNRGRIDQLMSELKDRKEEFSDENKGIRFFDTMAYLADLNSRAIASIVVKAVEAMDWLKEVATIAGENKKGIYWTTPSGFPVLQEYKKAKMNRVDSYWGSVRVQLTLQKETPKVDTRKGTVAIAPNFTHSNDAAHLMLTIAACKNAGIMNFAMIHDSFGTHAGDTERLSHIIRETFVDMYRGNILEDFRNQVAEQLPEELAAKLPPVPELGDFDINKVLTSTYFFA